MRTQVMLAALALTLALASDSRGTSLVDQNGKAPQRLSSDRVESADRGAPPDTVWFGGFDGSVAVPGGIWDFEDGTLQGWTSVDRSDMPSYMRRVTRDDFAASGSLDCTISGNASMWCGAFENEALAQCWPGGQGYSNTSYMHAKKTFTYAGTGNVTLAFDYFVDSEWDFDFTFVYVIDDAGIRSDTLRTYTGSVQEGSNIGSPDLPAPETITVTPADLPSGGTSFTVDIVVVSDAGFSDGIDWLYPQFLDSVHGPFGFDNFYAIGDGLSDFSDFEDGADGWVTYSEPAVGAFMAVDHLSELEPVPQSESCSILDPGNDYVLTAFDDDGPGYPHPHRQWEDLLSPPVYVGPGSGAEGLTQPVVDLSLWKDFTGSGVAGWTGHGFTYGVVYYPWTCPETGSVGWSPNTDYTGDGGVPEARCRDLRWDYSPVPATIDSMRVVITMISNCETYVPQGLECEGPAGGNQSPYWDDVRLGLTTVVAGQTSSDFCTDPVTNQNGIWEPGEMIRIEVDVAAIGADMTGVMGTLMTTSPDVTIRRDVATWPDIPAGTSATSNAPHFLVDVKPDATCFTTVDFELTVSSQTVGPILMSFSENIGGPLVVQDLPVGTIDNESVTSELVVTEDVTITDLDVQVQMAHTWMGDISVTLTSPSNTEVTLLDRPGVPASEFGCSDENMDVFFDDDSGVLLEDHCADTNPWYQGTAAPFSPLSAFNGESTAGTWTLTVSDGADFDGGQLDAWQLFSTPELSPFVCTTCDEVVTVGEAPAAGRATLAQNHPNPFNPLTQITFGVVEAGNVTLDIFSVTGRLVHTLIDESLEPGTYEVKWDGIDGAGRAVASGVYFYRLTTDEARIVRQMSLLK